MSTRAIHGRAPHTRTDSRPLLDQLVQDAELEPDLKSYLDRQERGDAELFLSLFRDRVIYDHAEKSWYLWTGNYWELDRAREIFDMLVSRLPAEYFRAASESVKAGDKDEAGEFAKRAHLLMTRHRAENVLNNANALPGMKLTGDEWDLSPMLLAVNNGVLDLKTGAFRSGQPRDYIRVHAPVDWMGPDFPAPTWKQFLLEVFQDDIELVNFMQRLFGYCLTGKTTEHRLPILYGEGRNGKTTLLEALANVFGPDLSHTTQADSLMDIKRDGAGPQPFVYALRGRRLVWATESREGQRINAGLVKQLTGGDSITTRTMFSDVVTFRPSHKVLLLTNHKPHVSADDLAMWDRLLLIEFGRRFVEHPAAGNERPRDAEISSKLQAEAPGILAWLVRGCLAWQAEGLNPPACVLAATDAYREDEDTFGDFIADCLVVGPGLTALAKPMHAEYKQWAKDAGIDHTLTLKSFAQKMQRRFGVPKRIAAGKLYSGVGLPNGENGTQTYG